MEDYSPSAAVQLARDAIGVSVDFDSRLASFDIECTVAHVRMLARAGILAPSEAQALQSKLGDLRLEVATRVLPLSSKLEDIHSNLEHALERLAGLSAGYIKTARARNDLAVCALRMWLREQLDTVSNSVTALLDGLLTKAERWSTVVMVGYSHLQPAQPLTLGYVYLAHAIGFNRDLERIRNLRVSLSECALGAGAMVGTSFNIDRHSIAEELDFQGPSENALDTVADRDFVLEALSTSLIIATRITRFAADLKHWISPNVEFMEEAHPTRGEHFEFPTALERQIDRLKGASGPAIASLAGFQAVVCALPLSYFRDLQEDKEPLFSSYDALVRNLSLLKSAIEKIVPNTKNMLDVAQEGYTTAVDYAEWISKTLNMPYKETHELVAKLVAVARASSLELGELSTAQRMTVHPRLGPLDWPNISTTTSVAAKSSYGGTAPVEVVAAILRLQHRVQTTVRTSGQCNSYTFERLNGGADCDRR